MSELVRGQKQKLSDLTPSTQLEIGVKVAAAPGQEVDVSCFGLDGDGKLSDERYFIFYNQKDSPCGALSSIGSKHGDDHVFRVDVGRIPATIRKLVFVATLDGAGTMRDIRPSHLRMHVDGRPVATFAFDGSAFSAEKAVMIAELYFKDVWRFAAVGQGFAGGLSAVLAHFGGQEAGGKDAGGQQAAPAAPPPKPAAPPPPAPPPPKPAAAPPPAPPAAPPPKVNLGKVTLEKRGASQPISLKKGGGSQPFHINLNWDAPKKQGGIMGFLTGTPAAPDLDLGCMVKLTNGVMTVIQPLGGNFGNRNGEPWVYLDKDDRSGAASDGENLYLVRPDLIEKVMIFAMIYEGAAKFTDVNARLTIKDDQGSEILIKLDNGDPSLRFCVIAMINRRGDRVEISKEESYFPGHPQADERYGFGFSWKAGRK